MTPQVTNKQSSQECNEHQSQQQPVQGECNDQLQSPPGNQQTNRHCHPNFGCGQSNFNQCEQQHHQCDHQQVQHCQQGQPKTNMQPREHGRPHHMDDEQIPATQQLRVQENNEMNCQQHQDAPPGGVEDHGWKCGNGDK